MFRANWLTWSCRRSAVFALALVLPACGFQPRGQAALGPSLRSVHIATTDRYSPFYRELTTTLRASGAELTNDPDVADAVIRIKGDNTGQRVLSVSTRNVPAEYDVFYTIRYEIWVKGAVVLEPQTLTRNRDYTYDETAVLGKSREEAIIREALAADLAGLVTRRLNALN